MLAHLINQSRGLLLAAAIASVVSGVCGVLLVSQINTALSVENHTAVLAWTFTGLAVAVMLGRMLSGVLFERLGQYALAELRRYISDRVQTTGLRRLEVIGSAKVQSALSEHSANVAQFFMSLPGIVTNSVIIIGCMIYMALLSWQIFLAAVVMVGLGSLVYHLVHLQAMKFLGQASREQDRMFAHFRALTDGAKELRLNADKRARFNSDVLGDSIETVRRNRTTGMSIFLISTSWGSFLIYAFIGLVLFVLVGDIPERTRVMTGFALIFMYMVVPLEVLLLNIPRINLARVAAERIAEITQDIPVSESAETKSPVPLPSAFNRLQLRGVTHRYYHEQSDEVFELGPLNLEFHPGSVTFLVGGNGSGKTTLAKLLVGLYAPESGEVTLDGECIDEHNRDVYRQLFSAIFSDFHLFERLLELERADLDEIGNRLLQRLHLQHKVKVSDGAFTTQALSQGQRKRLALVAACLEDRPFLVFDEWAADQDPVFKDVFYRELLPELKAQGKTVLVISHDDRYFHLGDRLLKLEDGQLSKFEQADSEAAEVVPVRLNTRSVFSVGSS